MTRVCPDCGEALEPDEQFCGNCGCYLDWSEADEPEPVAEPEPESVPTSSAASRRGFGDRMKSALGVGDHPPPPPGARGLPPPPSGPPPSGPPPSGPPPSGRPVPATPPVVGRHQTAERPDQNGQPAGALVVPVDQPAAQQPRAQQPGRPRPKPKPRSTLPPPEPLNPGDLVCGNCGAGNKPTRKFCRRCGDDLSVAEVAKVPWWKRIFRRKPKAKEAGSRPRGARRRPRVPVGLFMLLGILGALGVGVFFFRGVVMDGVEAVRDRIAGVEPREPSPRGGDASSSQPGHGHKHATDGDPKTYWAPSEPGDGSGQWIEVAFDEPVRLVSLLVATGVSKDDQEAFQSHGRPSELEIVLSIDGGGTRTVEADLDDERADQEVGIGVSDVTRVHFEITDSYEAPRGTRTGIREIDFFVRQ